MTSGGFVDWRKVQSCALNGQAHAFLTRKRDRATHLGWYSSAAQRFIAHFMKTGLY